MRREERWLGLGTIVTFKRVIAASVIGVGLAGCGTPISANRPIVDMEGVDVVKHNRDMAACEAWVASQAITFGNATERCMREKGYKILKSAA